jgi:hypothetical protein
MKYVLAVMAEKSQYAAESVSRNQAHLFRFLFSSDEISGDRIVSGTTYLGSQTRDRAVPNISK